MLFIFFQEKGVLSSEKVYKNGDNMQLYFGKKILQDNICKEVSKEERYLLGELVRWL